MDVAQRNREMAAKDAEIERLTEAHKDCDYAIDNNYRAWQEAQAEIEALKARVERQNAYANAIAVGLRMLATDYDKAVSLQREIYAQHLLPGDIDDPVLGDLADVDPAPVEGEV